MPRFKSISSRKLYKQIHTQDAEMLTDPSPLFSVVHAEMNDIRGFVANANGSKDDMIEVVRRVFRLLEVDPEIKDIEFFAKGMRVELVLKCRDTRLAFGEKGSVIKQATKIIEEAIGMTPLGVFVARCL